MSPSTRKTIAATVAVIAILLAGWFGIARYRQGPPQPEDVPAPTGLDWVPLSYLESTADLAIITGSFGGMTGTDRFSLTTTRQVATSEGTYLETDTKVIVLGIDSRIQSTATGAYPERSALARVAPGTSVAVLVQGTMQKQPILNGYLVIIP